MSLRELARKIPLRTSGFLVLIAADVSFIGNRKRGHRMSIRHQEPIGETRVSTGRFYQEAVLAAMQGMLANRDFAPENPTRIAELAIEQADALIEAMSVQEERP